MVYLKKIVLVIDDGGFPFEKPNSTGYDIPFDAYKRVLELARESNTVIPIAVTACFIDVDNQSGKGAANKNSEQIIEFLKEHSDFLPVWNHGLTHTYKNASTEFMLLRPIEAVPESIQREHIQLSQGIFEQVGLSKPKVLVPPGHAWEPGITDRIARDEGLKSIAIREFEKKSMKEWIFHPKSPYLRVWQESLYLKTLYRLGLGIPYRKYDINTLDYIIARQFIAPSNRFIHFMIHRKTTRVRRPHHFFAHIHNFRRKSSEKIWRKIVNILLNNALLEDGHYECDR